MQKVVHLQSGSERASWWRKELESGKIIRQRQLISSGSHSRLKKSSIVDEDGAC